MSDDYITFTIEEKKDIALIAHDNEKPKLIEWCKENYNILKHHNLYGTGTTSRMIADQTGLRIKAYNSGDVYKRQIIRSDSVELTEHFLPEADACRRHSGALQKEKMKDGREPFNRYPAFFVLTEK